MSQVCETDALTTITVTLTGRQKGARQEGSRQALC